MNTGLKQGRGAWLVLCAMSLFTLTQSVQAASNLIEDPLVSKRKDRTEYVLDLSKHKDLCKSFQDRMNIDLEKGDRQFGRHQAFLQKLVEFGAISWRQVKIFHHAGNQKDGYEYGESAVFDINNDGALDYVIRVTLSLSGVEADGIYVFDEQVANREAPITFQELFSSKHQIHIAGGFYPLSEPLAGNVVPLWRLSPFVYAGTSYLYMQGLYRSGDEVREDRVVIGKYIGGRVVGRPADGKIDDICYIRRSEIAK